PRRSNPSTVLRGQTVRHCTPACECYIIILPPKGNSRLHGLFSALKAVVLLCVTRVQCLHKTCYDPIFQLLYHSWRARVSRGRPAAWPHCAGSRCSGGGHEQLAARSRFQPALQQDGRLPGLARPGGGPARTPVRPGLAGRCLIPPWPIVTL